MTHDPAAHLAPELRSLALVALAASLMWIPYLLARVARHGVWAALANPPEAPLPLPAWAERAQRAHANAVENIAVFAPLVLIASCIDAADLTTVRATQVYLVSRLVHYGTYTLGIPVARTLAFLCGFAATAVVAGRIFGLAVAANAAR